MRCPLDASSLPIGILRSLLFSASVDERRDSTSATVQLRSVLSRHSSRTTHTDVLQSAGRTDGSHSDSNDPLQRHQKYQEERTMSSTGFTRRMLKVLAV